MPRFLSKSLLVAALCWSTAAAATITQTFTQPQSATTWVVANIPFSQFNPDLGTLNTVTIAFAGTFTQSATLSVSAGIPDQTISKFTAVADLLLFKGANFAAQYADISASVPAITNPGVTIASGTSQTFDTAGDFLLSPTAEPSLAPYIGTGTINFSLAGTAGFSMNGGGLVSPSVTTRSGGTVTLAYDYTAASPVDTPEPATFGLVGVAAAGLFLLRRKP